MPVSAADVLLGLYFRADSPQRRREVTNYLMANAREEVFKCAEKLSDATVGFNPVIRYITLQEHAQALAAFIRKNRTPEERFTLDLILQDLRASITDASPGIEDRIAADERKEQSK